MKTSIEGECGLVVIEAAHKDMPETPVRVFVHEVGESAAAFLTIEEDEVLALHLQLVIKACKGSQA